MMRLVVPSTVCERALTRMLRLPESSLRCKLTMKQNMQLEKRNPSSWIFSKEQICVEPFSRCALSQPTSAVVPNSWSITVFSHHLTAVELVGTYFFTMAHVQNPFTMAIVVN